MAGQQYGQFGPGPGGPYGWRGRLLCCLAPLLTLGLLGVVPSLLLAARRRRAVDALGAAVFALLTLIAFITLGLESKNSANPALGGVMIVLWLGAPVHFLLLDQPRFWGLPGRAPVPFVPFAARPAQPEQRPAAPARDAEPDDLQQLGELLRRQVQDRRP